VIALWLLAGGLVGTANGLTRWWTISHLRHEMRLSPLALVWGGLTVRLALAAALLIIALRNGIIPGLLAFAGLWLARWGTAIWFGARPRREEERLKVRDPTSRRGVNL
jgi:hypothetical protein